MRQGGNNVGSSKPIGWRSKQNGRSCCVERSRMPLESCAERLRASFRHGHHLQHCAGLRRALSAACQSSASFAQLLLIASLLSA